MPGGVERSNLDKLFWPQPGLTKGDLLEYFDAIAPFILPVLRDRPLTIVRYPDGIGGFSFYQKDTPKYAPDWVSTVKLHAGSARRDVRYTVCNSRRTLLWLANQAAIELHPWLSRVDRLERPDHLVLDLDPPQDRFDLAVQVAGAARQVLGEFGLEGAPKTSGSKGIHVYLPLGRRYEYGVVRSAAARLAERIVDRLPHVATTEFKKAERGGRLFVDIGRNAPGAHVVAAYWPRARPAATVSFPVEWERLDTVKPDDFTLRSVPGLLDQDGDRWQQLMPPRQSLGPVLEGGG